MTPQQLQERLQALCPYSLHVKMHESKSTYASASRKGQGVSLSLHKLFLHSPTPVLEALIRFAIKPDRSSRSIIRQMAHLYFTRINPPKPDLSVIDTSGRNIDLQLLFDEVNRSFFNSMIKVPITWFEIPHYRKFRHVTFGMYDRTMPEIRINRLLDLPGVPLPFVEFIVYHEMLHDVCLPHLDARGRMIVHTREFRQREALHPHYAFSKEWEKKSLTFFKRIHHGRS